jgi:hypothetical protein
MAKKIKDIYKMELKHPEWQRRRLEIMSRDEFCCKYCGDKDTTLNVHHIDYMGKAWQADGQDLITLCEPCHKYVAHNPDITEVLSVHKFKEVWCIAFIVSCIDREVIITVASHRTDTFLFSKKSEFLKTLYNLNSKK